MSLKNRIIMNELKNWLNNNYIDDELFSQLSVMYDKPWDATVIIRWTLVLGAVIMGIGIILFIGLMVNSTAFVVFILSALTAAAFAGGLVLSGDRFRLPKTGNALIALSCLLFGSDVFMIAKMLAEMMIIEGENWPALLLIISAVYFIVAYMNKNPVVLLFGLLGVATWYGAESGYISGWGAYFFGMNYPLRFAVASPVVILAGYLQKKYIPIVPRSFVKIYYIIGLLYTNLALWILSIFGTSTEFFSWHANHPELFFFSLLWGIFSVASFIIGTRFVNRTFTGFAITFFILNLYTRYFEYFWDSMNKALFFILLGGISIGIGILFEKKIRRKKEEKN